MIKLKKIRTRRKGGKRIRGKCGKISRQKNIIRRMGKRSKRGKWRKI